MKHLKTLKGDQEESLFVLITGDSMKERENLEKKDDPIPEEEGHAGIDLFTNLCSFANILPKEIKIRIHYC